MDSQMAASEITTKRDELFKAMDNLIEAAVEEQRYNLAPGKSARFQSELNKLCKLEEEGKTPKAIRDASRGVKAMIDTVIPEIDSDLPRMLGQRKHELDNYFDKLLDAISRI